MDETISSNIIDQNTTNNIIKKTLETLSNSLSKSLGPYGSTTIIQDKFSMNPTITKDGYTILNKIKFKSEISTTILEIVKKISKNLVREVGDGSTSAIIVSNALYKGLYKLIDKYNIPSKDILDVLNSYEKIIKEYINKFSIEINDNNFNEIKKIASVANNNDDKAGDLIFNVYKQIGKNGFINLKTSYNNEDSYKINNGMIFFRGNVNPLFSNQPDKISCEFDKPRIFMCNDIIDENDLPMLQELLGNICCTNRENLVIIAKGYDIEVKNFFQINKLKNKDLLNFIPVDYALVNKEHRDSFEDLATYVNCKIYDKANGLANPDIKNIVNSLGLAEHSSINESETKFIEGKGNKKEIDDRIKLIEKEIKKIKNNKDSYVDASDDLFSLQKRIADLKCLTATIYVGGNSDIEKQTRKFLMEDAMLACKSALKNGYIIGGNLIIPIICNKYKKDINTKINKEFFNLNISNKKEFFNDFIEMIENSFKQSFIKVLKNKNIDNKKCNEIIDECIKNESIYNLKNMKFEKFNESSIINSSLTDIEIMKACFSIIGLVVTSNQFISNQFITD